MKTYVQDGKNVQVTAPYTVTSGQGCLVGSLFGVATTDIASGALGELRTYGVVTLTKVSAQAWTAGALIYWDDSAKDATTTSSGNKLIGVALAAAANPSANGTVRLNGSFST